jgi:acyl dehydratase
MFRGTVPATDPDRERVTGQAVRNWIGWRREAPQYRRKPALTKITFPIEATHIMMFARAIGDENPVYHDAEKARGSEVGGIVTPPTFAVAVAQFNPEGSRPRPGEKWFGSGKTPSGIEGRAPSAGGMNAEQHFEYFRPVRPGEVLTAETRPGKTWERESKRAGKLSFAERITEFRDESGELVISLRGVSVKTERPVDQG